MKVLLFSSLLIALSNAFVIQLQKVRQNEEDHTVQLVGQISLGTPPQNFNVLFNTMNADFWIVDKSCTDQECKGFPEAGYTKNQYDKSKSSTYKASNSKFKINVGSGVCSGDIAIDKLTLAGYNVANQSFGSASTVPGVFGYLSYDGMLGLGLAPSENSSTIASVINNLLDLLPKPIFTVWINRHDETSPNPSGQITFGIDDTANCDQKTAVVPLTSSSFWQFTIDKFQFASYSSKKTAQAISDSSTEFLGVPSTILSTIAKTLHADYDETYQFYTVSCDSISNSPQIWYTAGDKELFIESQDYILDYGLGNNKCVVAMFDMANTNLGVDWLLSMPFIRSYCNVYSIKDKTIGFARAIHY